MRRQGRRPSQLGEHCCILWQGCQLSLNPPDACHHIWDSFPSFASAIKKLLSSTSSFQSLDFSPLFFCPPTQQWSPAFLYAQTLSSAAAGPWTYMPGPQAGVPLSSCSTNMSMDPHCQLPITTSVAFYFLKYAREKKKKIKKKGNSQQVPVTSK